MMTTIGRLSRRYGLSRSTLLYYDKAGVLKPSARSENGYRAYSDADARRLLEPIGNIPPAEAEAHYYGQINELAMVA